jgi:signal transduction histidine kinase
VILNVLLSVAVFLNLLMGFFVISQNPRSINNRFFALMSFIAALWTFANFMTGIQPVEFWLKSTYATGALVTSISISLILLIINRGYNKRISLPIISISIFFALGSYLPSFIAKNYEQIYAGGVFVGEPGIGLIIYTIFFLSGAIYILWKIIVTKNHTKEKERRAQLQLIFDGTLILVLISAFTSFIFPSLSIFYFGGLDSVGLLFYMSFIAYAITKHHLFNIKVLATELLIFILWIVILIRTVLAEDLQSLLVEAGLLITSIIIGVLLIRSVINEVSQREKIEALAEQLRIANAGQVNLMHVMNHQIKGRLGNMRNIFAELMTEDYGKIPTEAVPLLQKGLSESEIGVNYVQGILRGISAETGTLPYDMKDTDFKGVVEKMIEYNKEKADRKGLEYRVSINPGEYKIIGDEVQLSEAIKNMIDNSIAYTPAGSVTISLERKEGKALFSVKDTGVGINDSDKQKLFKAGGRGQDSIKVNVNSTGYGLAFVKGVVEAHKGKVWAESQGEGKGSQFYIELPLKA